MTEERPGAPDAAVEADRREGQAERYLVRLAVRFVEAKDYVLEYAENLSRGGLFIAGAEHLKPLEEVTIRIDLPGFGAYDVTCRVAHTLSPEQAAKHGRRPGAGFAIMDAPAGFEAALARYLRILGRRRDVVVAVASDDVHTLLDAAGYGVERVTSPAAAASLAAREDVLAVVVPEGLAPEYRRELATTPLADRIVGLGSGSSTDQLLNALDSRISLGG